MTAIEKMGLLAFVCTLSTSVIAEDWKWGMAGSIGSESAIRAPITNGNIVIEPFISRSHYQESQMSFNNQKSDSNSIGLGVWKVFDLQDQFTLRAGLAAAYVKESQDSSYGSGDNYTKTEGDYDGYSISPGVGVFYQINSNLLLGLESSYHLNKVKGESTSNLFGSPASTIDAERSSEYTTTAAVLEFYF